MPEVTFTLMKPEDMEAICAIEQDSFSDPWARDLFETDLHNSLARWLLIWEDVTLIGYAGMWLVIDEAQILNVAIASAKRGQGYGEMLMQHLLQLASDSGMTFATLECRRSNIRAQSLYHKLGFIDVGYRKRYYTNNNEDALVMVKEDMPESHPENDPFLTEEIDADTDM